MCRSTTGEQVTVLKTTVEGAERKRGWSKVNDIPTVPNTGPKCERGGLEEWRASCAVPVRAISAPS